MACYGGDINEKFDGDSGEWKMALYDSYYKGHYDRI